MPSQSQGKLDEARFFLDRMKETPATRVPFVYYFNAFLASARTVTLVMQDEFARVPGFIDWYCDKRQQMKSDALMSAMKTIRDANLHRTPVRPTMQVRMPVGDNAVIIDHMEFETPRADGTKQIAEPAETVFASPGIQMRWIVDGINDRDVIGACEEYLAKLAAIVNEYEERFAR